MINFVIEKSYVQLGGHVFLQIAGTPMGGNASPMIADLSLGYLEFKYLQKAKPWKKEAIVFRYVDDILVINEDLDAHIQNMYPKELVLNKEND